MMKNRKQIVKRNEKRISIKKGGRRLKEVRAEELERARKESAEFNRARDEEDRAIYGWDS